MQKSIKKSVKKSDKRSVKKSVKKSDKRSVKRSVKKGGLDKKRYNKSQKKQLKGQQGPVRSHCKKGYRKNPDTGICRRKNKSDDCRQKKIAYVMSEFKNKSLKLRNGKKVVNPRQAIAIALSEASKKCN